LKLHGIFHVVHNNSKNSLASSTLLIPKQYAIRDLPFILNTGQCYNHGYTLRSQTRPWSVLICGVEFHRGITAKYTTTDHLVLYNTAH